MARVTHTVIVEDNCRNNYRYQAVFGDEFNKEKDYITDFLQAMSISRLLLWEMP
jgi:hypothetical protein